METIKLQGKTYSNVPSVTLPTDPSGTADFIAKSNLLAWAVGRNDAELIKTYSDDEMLVDDKGITIPSYSTSSTTLLASSNLTPTVSLNFDSYNYYVIERMLTIPEYSTSSKAKGRQEYAATSYLYEIVRIPANTFQALIDTTKHTSANYAATSQAYIRDVYWSSGTALGIYTATSYGIHQVGTAPGVTSGTLTLKTPSITIRGHTTYFTSTFFNALTDCRLQYVIDVYRAPKNNLNLDGWGQEQQMLHIINDVNNNNQNLT